MADHYRHSTDSITAPEDGFIRAGNRLGVELAQRSYRGENLVVSPFSLLNALAIVGAGASGDFAAALDRVLGANAQERARYSARVLAKFPRLSEAELADLDLAQLPEKPIIHLASQVALASDSACEIRPDYLHQVGTAYRASVIRAERAELKAACDAWVQTNTASLIDQSAIEIDPMFRLGIQNALLFASRWAKPFSPDKSYHGDFTRGDGQVVRRRFMTQTVLTSYADTEEFFAVRLPYAHPDVVADVMCPRTGDIGTLDADAVRAMREAYRPAREVSVDLPPFIFRTTAQLLPLMRAAGLDACAVGNLDGIGEKMTLDQGVQQNVLEVSEQGTKAAAVSEFGVRAMSLAPPEDPVKMVFDRPFIFQLRHRRFGALLFHALVGDPAQSEGDAS